MTDLASAIAHGRETTTIDFKARLAWQTGRAAQMAVVRDVVGLANREGGAVVIGVSDRGDGSFDFTGLAADDTLPDPTELNTLLRDYFDPATSVGISEGMTPERADGWIAAWATQAVRDGLERGSVYWEAAWTWIAAERQRRSRP
jgi:Putative DNA-binding domain